MGSNGSDEDARYRQISAYCRIIEFECVENQVAFFLGEASALDAIALAFHLVDVILAL